MRAFCLLLPILSLPSVLAVPTSEQVILGDVRPFSGNAFDDVTQDFLNDTKKVILKGKTNMQKWFHDGKEFIKQNGLMCECGINEIWELTERNVLLIRRICVTSLVY